MLNNRFFEIFRIICCAGEKIGFIPYRFDRSKRVLTLSNQQTRQRYIGLFLACNIWFVFICFQAIRFKKIRDFNSFNLSYTFVIGTFIVIVTNVLNVFLYKDVIRLFEAMIILNNYLSMNFLKHGNPVTRRYSLILNSLAIIITFSLPAAGIMLFSSFCLYPNLPVLFGNLISNESYHWWVAVPCAIFYGSSMCVMYGNLAFLSEILVVYMMVFVPILTHEFNLSSKFPSSKYQMKDSMRTQSSNLIAVYRAVQLLHGYCMSIFGVFLVPLHGLILHLVGFGIFLGVEHRKDLHISTLFPVSLWCVFGFVLWVTVLMVGGFMHLQGRRTIRSWTLYKWRDPLETKIMKKFAKSCCPLSLSYGKAYLITRLSTFKFFSTLNKVTFRTILTFRNV